MSDFLADMATRSRQRADLLPGSVPASELDRPLFALRFDRFDLIAEIKARSPAEGALAEATMNVCDRAGSYVEGGAAAISVLTEPERFDGSLDHLSRVADALCSARIPALRKDFLVDPRQVTEARVHGASGVLLITALLDDSTLASMLDRALDLGLFVLLEAFDAQDLARMRGLLTTDKRATSAEAGQLLFGVNTRNLRSLAVDPNRLERLAGELPATAIAVAESGLKTPDDAARVRKLGYGLGLVGTALMRSDDPAALVQQMLAAGRDAVAG